MELVYLWVEEYKNIKKQGFNFSPRFECEFDGKVLTIEEKEYTSIFPENINITAIVGENGSGKSSIQSLLNTICSKINIKLDFKYILLISINNSLHYESNFKFNKPSSFIKNTHNISILTYFNSIEEKTIEEVNNKIKYIHQINSIKLSNNEINKLMTMHMQENQPFPKTSFFYFPTKIFIKPIDFSNLFDEIVYKGEVEINNSLDLLEFFVNIDDKYHKFLILLFIERNILNIEELSNITYLKNKFKKDKTYLSDKEFKKYFIEVEKDMKSLTKKEREIYLYDFYDFFEIDYIDSSGRNWDSLSTGEKMNFGIFLNLYFFYRVSEENNNNLLITFDEIELCLHSNWQKSFLSEFTNFIEKFNIACNLIISTHSPFILSDLPKENVIFLDKVESDKNKTKEKYPNLNIDDLEEGNCIDVSKYIDIKPFGANIHTLLSHGFFMKDGLMGEFAKEKIKEIFKYLKDDKKLKTIKKEDVFDFINIIGEDFLREKLLKMYDEKFSITKEEKLKELKKEVEKLEKELKNG